MLCRMAPDDLFTPLEIRSVGFRNRIAVSPMCQYSCTDGVANAWHTVHLGSRAVGGAGLVMAEATAVEARGRISPADHGLWNDAQVEPLTEITSFIRQQGAVPGVQLAHAGRKASTAPPWQGGHPLGEPEGGWQPIVAPSPVPFDDRSQTPEALDLAGIAMVAEAFAAAAARAQSAGFQVIEIHAAHGYLLHEFLSPICNQRSDAYGGSFGARTRIVCEVIEAVRARWPDHLPLFLRISASDWIDGGWTIDDTVALSHLVRPLGVDLVDCSSGGIMPGVHVPAGPGYQVPFAERVRRESGILTAAVGLITAAEQADQIIRNGEADMVFMARELLRDPYWPIHAAQRLGRQIDWPAQYLRAKP
jgi:2,4-dienoyl-CoA reductase-like NADH-dependent reductase (Old Yellow Enzyme family)